MSESLRERLNEWSSELIGLDGRDLVFSGGQRVTVPPTAEVWEQKKAGPYVEKYGLCLPQCGVYVKYGRYEDKSLVYILHYGRPLRYCRDLTEALAAGWPKGTTPAGQPGRS